MPSPSPGADDYLSGVSCSGPARCVAVGSQSADYVGLAYTLAETWDGSAWSLSPSPTPLSLGAYLSGTRRGMAAGPGGGGYWLADTAGDVTAHGDARLYGSLTGNPVPAPVGAFASTPDGGGY